MKITIKTVDGEEIIERDYVIQVNIDDLFSISMKDEQIEVASTSTSNRDIDYTGSIFVIPHAANVVGIGRLKRK